MATEALQRAFEVTRGVLANVKDDQLDDPTPCASWKVRDLVDHIIGGSHWFASSVSGVPLAGGGEGASFAEGDRLAAYDAGIRASVEAFEREGALEKMIELPFGAMPGSAFLGIATTDTFVHAWDLARASGQDTDLDPELATQLLEGARAFIPDSFRGPEPAPFGPVVEVPESAPPADQLAGFLGRQV